MTSTPEQCPLCNRTIIVDDAKKEIERLRLWLCRIENINDDPACFSVAISHACSDALDGKPMIGMIDAARATKK